MMDFLSCTYESHERGDDAHINVPSNIESVMQRLFTPMMEELQNTYRQIGVLEKKVRQLELPPPALPAPVQIVQPRFRWDWLNKLLTVETQDVG